MSKSAAMLKAQWNQTRKFTLKCDGGRPGHLQTPLNKGGKHATKQAKKTRSIFEAGSLAALLTRPRR
ncbi:hypothetical protein NOR53_2502 [gamma proteobacterium NOR5-3]|nr:hypothetical protein NOR53_2502 [gamma proteobacterium NOR5-3]